MIVNFDDKEFDALVVKIVAEIRKSFGAKARDKWIDGEEAMAMLRIKSPTTLAKIRNEGKIRFSQPEPRIILYDTDSIEAYLEKNAKDTF